MKSISPFCYDCIFLSNRWNLAKEQFVPFCTYDKKDLDDVIVVDCKHKPKAIRKEGYVVI
jgi:hypothetical protein